jgi:hypothetical protein
MANDFKMEELFENLTVSGKQDPGVCPATKSPGKCRRNGSKPAHPDEVVHFGRDEEDFQRSSPLPRSNFNDARTVPLFPLVGNRHSAAGAGWPARLAASASFATQAGPICGGRQLQSKQRNGGPFNDNKHVSEENTSGSFHDLGVLDLRP